MKNSIGTSVILTLSGESHGEALCAVLDGLAPGIPVDETFIAAQLSRRRPGGATDTARREQDAFRIVSGVFKGYTTGTPLTILIPNENVRSSDYDAHYGLARPSHADYTAHVKYRGFEDYRGGGHFSGRITAGIVAAGAVALTALQARGIRIGTHILSCGGVQDRPFGDFGQDFDHLENRDFPVLDEVEEAMRTRILEAREQGDSLGGIIQTAVTGMPAGVGEPWFDSLEGMLANALFSIGGIKGVEFGAGFSLAAMRGSEANDAFRLTDGQVQTATNRSGGINGGISNGMPILFQAAVKPTPSISRPQQTVNFLTGEEATLRVTGRHDPAIIRRICIVVTSLTGIVLCDALALRFGTDYLGAARTNGGKA
ncbi:MAG: chorismate synthase [Bacteroidales bacterium]|nr:chorismate synthase [Bacteroidales bacterium]